MEFLSVKWLWLYAGVFLMMAEILMPGFVVFFFGLAAAAVGGMLFLFDLSVTVQVAMFSILSVLFLLTLRRVMMTAFMSNGVATAAIENEYVGRVGEVIEMIRPGVPGRILLGDSEWTATAGEVFEPGVEVRVVAQNGLTFSVVKV